MRQHHSRADLAQLVLQDRTVPSPKTQSAANLLLAHLPRKERDSIIADCEQVQLGFGHTLCEPDEAYTHAWLPQTGFISIMVPLTGHPPLEVGLIGNEGMLGATLALGIDRVPMRAVVQGEGTALRIPVAALNRHINGEGRLRGILDRYLYVLLTQLSQTAACTRFHEVDTRLARWLLMTHDRAHADHFHLTHQYLADMLGVQRSAVTIAAGALKAKRLIRYSRGQITVVSRRGLEASSCECYDAVIEDYAQVLG